MDETNAADAAPVGDRAGTPAPKPGLIGRVFTGPVALGGVLSVGFYMLSAPAGPLHTPVLARYTTGHPLAYATVVLFCVGIAAVLARVWGTGRERAAVAAADRHEAGFGSADAVRDWLAGGPAWVAGTVLGRRVRDLLDAPLGLAVGGGAVGGGAVEPRLRMLSDAEADRIHDGYALVRTVTWAVPILGFLGTVVGITLAIAGIDPEQLNTSLGDVTGGLAVAFDTTALALFLSLVLVFATHLTEQSEHRVRTAVDAFALSRLAPLVAAAEPAAKESADPSADAAAATALLADAAARIGDELARRTAESAERQADGWAAASGAMRERFERTLAEQNERLAASMNAALAQSVRRTLEQNARVNDAAARELLETVKAGTEVVSGSLSRWADRVETASRAEATRSGELRALTDSFGTLVERVDAVTDLSDRIAADLARLRGSGRFEEAVHSLTAAAHLLTARAGGDVARPSDAATVPLERAA